METIEQLKSELLAARAEVEDLKGALEIATRSADDQMRQKREAEAQLATAKEERDEARKDADERLHLLESVLFVATGVGDPTEEDQKYPVIRTVASLRSDLVKVTLERDNALFQWKRNIAEHDVIHQALAADLAKANAAVEVLSTARTAIERSLEGAASFDGYYRHHRNAIAMMDKLGVKPVKENNDHGF